MGNSSETDSKLGLVADIGGTNCRLCLVHLDGAVPRLDDIRDYRCADYPTAEACIQAFLDGVTHIGKPRYAVLAAAGPVQAGTVRMTNNAWRLDEKQLAADLGMARVRLINDFAAQALAAPLLGEADVARIGTLSIGMPGHTVAIMGPGTGFGLAALAGGVHSGLLVTEGGHIAYAPTDQVERQVLEILARRHDRVSIERILAGPGMAELHAALEQIAGLPPSGMEAAAITRAAAAGDGAARTTVDRFCAILGSVAGDLTLALGAQGGVFIAGGIAPRLVNELQSGSFRQRFEAKGRFQPYMQAIPTHVITTAHAALRGDADELVRLAAQGGQR
jgi:glucokinase